MRGDASARRPGTVLLAHSFYLGLDPKQVRKMKPYPPLATLVAAAVLREKGWRVELFDAMLAAGEEEFEALVAEMRPARVAILEDNFNFLTKMCLGRMREAAFRMIRAARSVGATVVVNGSDATDRPESYLAVGADFLILGETEETLPELLERLDAGEEPRGVPGLAWSEEGRVVRSPAREPVRDLDALPLPARDLVDADAYRRAWTGAHGRFSTIVAASRGCPWSCNWCAKPIFGKRFTQRSPASVAAEVAHLRATWRPDHLWFADDILGRSDGWVAELARELEARDAVTPFTAQSRVDLMTPRMVAALREAGAEEMWLGAESGSTKVLRAMDKGFDVELTPIAVARLHDAGIRVGLFLQLGYPGEEVEELRQTIRMVRDLAPDEIGVSVSRPLPGTPFFERVKDELGAKTDWTDSDDLALLYRGALPPELYKALAATLHHEVDLRRELERRGEVADPGGARRAALAEEWRAIEALEPALVASAVA